MQLKKVCPVCKVSVIDASQPCCDRCTKRSTDRHKDYDKFRRDKKAAAFYHSKEWKSIVAYVKQKQGGIDRYAYVTKHKLVTNDLCVHHIIELSEDWSLRLVPDNLIVVSDASHKEIHKAYRAGNQSRREMQKLLLSIVSDGKKE